MKSRMRITLIVLVIVSVIARLMALWSEIDPVLLSKIIGSVWAVGLATIVIGYLTHEQQSRKDLY